jgi:pimeloyl-ACP methyl ester carboxylesterase
VRRLIAFVLIAVTCCACAGSKDPAAHLTVAGQPAQIWAVTGSHRAVIWLHGAGKDEALLDGPQSTVLRRLHAAGWIVASDRAHQDAWGDDASVADYKALVTLLRSHYGVREVDLFAASMGTLPALRLLRDGVASRLVAVSPVTDPTTVTNLGAPASVTDPQAWPPGALHGDLVTLIASPEDRLVSYSRNAAAFAARFNVRLVTCHGDHLDPSCFAAVRF